jgi:hypothetical protein
MKKRTVLAKSMKHTLQVISTIKIILFAESEFSEKMGLLDSTTLGA